MCPDPCVEVHVEMWRGGALKVTFGGVGESHDGHQPAGEAVNQSSQEGVGLTPGLCQLDTV